MVACSLSCLRFFILCVYGRITNNGISVYTQQSSTEIERICWFIWDNGFAFLSDPTLLHCGESQGTCTQILSCGACLKCLQDLVKRILFPNLARFFCKCEARGLWFKTPHYFTTHTILAVPFALNISTSLTSSTFRWRPSCFMQGHLELMRHSLGYQALKVGDKYFHLHSTNALWT